MTYHPVISGECENWRERHPEWIFCDDFEDTGALVKPGRYFEYDDNDGDFANINGVGIDGSHGMRVRFQEGEVGAGGIKVAFGRNPVGYMNKQNIRSDEDFREIYYRMYLKMQEGWNGSPAKLSRATCFPLAADWRQAMIAHLWSDDDDHLLIDPASCIDNNGNVVCTKYNDFDHLKWLGNKSGVTPIFSTEYSNRWFCIEAHVKLNDPGQSNGIQEFWIDGNLEARKTGLNFTGSFDEYAINAVFFENYWNSGSVKLQERYFDNIVISTEPIGPVANSSTIYGPKNKKTGSPVRVAFMKNRVLTINSDRTISRLSLVAASGEVLTDRTISDSRTVAYDCSSLAGGVCFYRICFTDKAASPCSGKVVRF
ncbi:MAG: hypothetical protein JW913_19850 [Chitinispirillaceae bacterium]|nr:hypothetical protein [Chitinispirillaceae bacterium]